jgi:hypothetical protein
VLLSQTRYTMLLNMSRGPHLDAYSIDGFRNKVIVTTQKNRDIGASPSSLPTFSHMLSIKLLSPPPLRVPPNAALRGGVRAHLHLSSSPETLSACASTLESTLFPAALQQSSASH